MDFFRLPRVLALLLVVTFVQPGANAQGRACRIELDKQSRYFNAPLLLNPPAGTLIYPVMESGKPIITINEKNSVFATCSRPFKTILLKNYLQVVCHDSKLTISDSEIGPVQWTDLECQQGHRGNLKDMNQACGNSGKLYKIGWYAVHDHKSNNFIEDIEICFNSNLETTLFVYHKLQGSIIRNKPPRPSGYRPSFEDDGLFTIDVAAAYDKGKSFFTNLLHPDTKFGEGDRYFARGHLAPDADFFYKAESDATYFYGNAVPQWQCTNNCNWKRLENSVRSLSVNRGITLRIWTGTYGLLQLPDENNNLIDMYLGLTEGKNKVPVPAVMWKVIQSPQTREAVAIVGINDVTGMGLINGVSVNVSPCQDVCNNIEWIKTSLPPKIRNNAEHGRIFCCKVNDLKKTIPYLPDLGNVGLLKN